MMSYSGLLYHGTYMPGHADISRPAARKSDRDTSFLHLRVLSIHSVLAVSIAIRHAIDTEDTPGVIDILATRGDMFLSLSRKGNRTCIEHAVRPFRLFL